MYISSRREDSGSPLANCAVTFPFVQALLCRGTVSLFGRVLFVGLLRPGFPSSVVCLYQLTQQSVC